MSWILWWIAVVVQCSSLNLDVFDYVEATASSTRTLVQDFVTTDHCFMDSIHTHKHTDVIVQSAEMKIDFELGKWLEI